MARVAVSIVGSSDLPDDALRRGAAALAARVYVQGIGPVVRSAGKAAMAALVRTDIGPTILHRSLESLSDTRLSYKVLSYGALIYRSDELNLPPTDVDFQIPALESLQSVDPGFEIPLLGNVTAHLGRDFDRPQS